MVYTQYHSSPSQITKIPKLHLDLVTHPTPKKLIFSCCSLSPERMNCPKNFCIKNIFHSIQPIRPSHRIPARTANSHKLIIHFASSIYSTFHPQNIRSNCRNSKIAVSPHIPQIPLGFHFKLLNPRKSAIHIVQPNPIILNVQKISNRFSKISITPYFCCPSIKSMGQQFNRIPIFPPVLHLI